MYPIGFFVSVCIQCNNNNIVWSLMLSSDARSDVISFQFAFALRHSQLFRNVCTRSFVGLDKYDCVSYAYNTDYRVLLLYKIKLWYTSFGSDI